MEPPPALRSPRSVWLVFPPGDSSELALNHLIQDTEIQAFPIELISQLTGYHIRSNPTNIHFPATRASSHCAVPLVEKPVHSFSRGSDDPLEGPVASVHLTGRRPSPSWYNTPSLWCCRHTCYLSPDRLHDGLSVRGANRARKLPSACRHSLPRMPSLPLVSCGHINLAQRQLEETCQE